MQLLPPVSDSLIKGKTVLAAILCGLAVTACNRQSPVAKPPLPEVAVATVARQPVRLTTAAPAFQAGGEEDRSSTSIAVPPLVP